MRPNSLPKELPKEFGTAGGDPLPTLMVEAFGSGRLAILRELKQGPRRYVDMARRLSSSESEVSRNLARLLEVGLVSKRPSGEFTLTPLGDALMTMVPTLDVLATHGETFRTHAIHALPLPFLWRVSDLAGVHVLRDPFAVLGAAEKVFNGVEAFFFGAWILGTSGMDEGQLAMQRLLRQRIERYRADARGILLPQETQLLRRAIGDVDSYFSIRTLASLPISFAVSDAGAVILFEDSPGRVDFNFALHGTDDATRLWARELFLHLWSGAMDSSSMGR